jgi:hypothetical protein
VGLDLTGHLNRSNQNYYDGLGTITLEDDVFTPRFYDYHSYILRPNISYAFSWIPLTATFSYSYQKLKYDYRKARFKDGSYKEENAWEAQELLECIIRYDLTENWDLIGAWEYLTASSNNDDESVYRYNYRVIYYSLGIAYRF